MSDPTAGGDRHAPEVTPEEAVRLLGSGAVLLDVREPEEWRAGHAPSAHHLPMGELGDRLGEVPGDRTVVCVCRVGGRSDAVATALAAAGYDARNLAGGMVAWEAAGLAVVADDGRPGRVA
ncbi:MAG TPA: rhodanese-like domain-containing protein [Acidimicrobiales bacterium]|nr:rhodanese-like domain-containing protein [Acidimicrobiales bacterium]